MTKITKIQHWLLTKLIILVYNLIVLVFGLLLLDFLKGATYAHDDSR